MKKRQLKKFLPYDQIRAVHQERLAIDPKHAVRAVAKELGVSTSTVYAATRTRKLDKPGKKRRGHKARVVVVASPEQITRLRAAVDRLKAMLAIGLQGLGVDE